jgi:glycosyltransferase involved in cell wall biosynthesis
VRVGLITRHLGLPVGFGTYATNLLTTLDALDADNEYVVYAPRWNDVPPLGPRFRVRRFPVPEVRSALTAWDLTVAPAAALRDRVDLLHYLHPAYPAANPRRPVVVNLLDAIGWVVPGYRLPQPYERLERRAASKADLVLTLSESARDDINRVLGVPRERIRVTYLGAPDKGPTDRQTGDTPYFLFVGGTEKRKNLRAVLQAFSGIDGIGLKVVGRSEPSPIHDARSDQPGVEWLGHVDADELARLYANATALVFPSLYEGFGLPVVEAMARRTPVIASNVSSIPEIAQDAALLVDPNDTAAIGDAMRRVAADAALRADLVERGSQVAARFTWEATARATLAAYEELCGSR